MRVGLSRTFSTRGFGVGANEGGHEQEGRAGGVSRHVQGGALEPGASLNGDRETLTLDHDPEDREQPLRVVAGKLRLASPSSRPSA